MLSTMSTVDWVLLGSGESIKSRTMAAFNSLSAGRTLPLRHEAWQENRANRVVCSYALAR